MSHSVYNILNNSDESLDIAKSLKEPSPPPDPSEPVNSKNDDSLSKRYSQIAFAVILYW